MSRFYRSVRFILRRAVGIYFYEIKATGQSRIPDSDPLIFASNHPNSLMDTVLLATQTDRQIQYMARSGLFSQNALFSAFLNHIGVIPIYRRQDGEGTDQNTDSFVRAYEALEDGGCIGIFPEGQNSPDRKVQQIKTGTARIALATEERNSFSLGLKIQPVGLNFQERTRFLSRVLIRFGQPIDVRDYADIYAESPRQAVIDLTETISTSMRRLATHIEDDRNRRLVMNIQEIYGHQLARRLIAEFDGDHHSPMTARLLTDEERADLDDDHGLIDRFDVEQRIADAVAYYQEHDPGKVARVRMDIRRYQDHLQQVRLRHELVEDGFDGLTSGSPRLEAIGMTAYAVGLGPIAIYGLINNFIPAFIVREVARRQTDETRIAFAGFATGLLLFPLFYAAQGWALWQLNEQALWVAIVYVATLIPAGLFFLRWWRQLLAYRDRILSRTLFRSRQNLLDTLENERQSLIETFEDMRVNYLQATAKEPTTAKTEAGPEPQPTSASS